MKILHLSKFYPPEPGGIENFVFDLANTQAEQGHDVYVISHQPGFAKPSRHNCIHGVHVDRIQSFGQLAYAPVCPEYFFRLHTVIQQFRPDVICAHLPNISAFWLLFLRKTCPLVLHWHADVVASKIDRKMSILYHFYKPWESALLKMADAIICTSSAYLEYSAPLRPFKKKCHVVPLGIDPARMEFGEKASGKMTNRNPDLKLDKKPDLSDFDLTVLGVGRFTYYKGFEYLVAAAEKTPRVRFHIVGDGPEYPAIKQQIAEKKLKNQVRLFGSVDRQTLIHLFRTCDVFCLPSVERTEAFGLVLLEAMYFGKPLITTQLPGSGVTTVNRHGETGLHVRPGDPDALADAILFLEKNLEIRKTMGRRAHQRFLDAFHIESVSSEIDKILKSL